MDYANATADWHLQSAPSLDDGRVQAGLVSDGALNIQKVNAIQNLTEGDMIDGLGLDEGFSIHLTIEVVESSNASRIGTMLFDGGTSAGLQQLHPPQIDSLSKTVKLGKLCLKFTKVGASITTCKLLRL